MLSASSPRAAAPQAIPRYKAFGPAVQRSEIETGLELGQFVAVFQPFVQPASGRVVLLEASIRWLHPRRGLLAPCDFVCEADQHGLLDHIAIALVEQAAAASHAWRSLAHASTAARALSVPIAINFSGALQRNPAVRLSMAQCVSGFGLLDALTIVELSDCDDSRAALNARLRQRDGRKALTNLSTLLQWYISAENEVELVQGDFICPPTQRHELAQALQDWQTAFSVIRGGM
jgi:hypothetical protein